MTLLAGTGSVSVKLSRVRVKVSDFNVQMSVVHSGRNGGCIQTSF